MRERASTSRADWSTSKLVHHARQRSRSVRACATVAAIVLQACAVSGPRAEAALLPVGKLSADEPDAPW